MNDTAMCSCDCHTGPYAVCSVLGGCGSVGCGRTTSGPERGRCFSGEHCKASELVGTKKLGSPTSDPLCYACLEAGERDTRALTYDYLDLAQLHETSLSQAISEKTAGSKEKQMLIVGHIEALQAEIVYVTTTWEDEVRAAGRLSDPLSRAPVADWHTTITKPTPLAKVRPGAEVQRAAGILAPRMRILSLLPPTATRRTGAEDPPEDICGWEAVHHLQSLHKRARAALGRTRRILSLHGTCPKKSCRAEALYRLEPATFKDDPPVWCDTCSTVRDYADYEWFMVHLMWPPHADDEPEQDEEAEATALEQVAAA